jgi:hypothetical protein
MKLSYILFLFLISYALINDSVAQSFQTDIEDFEDNISPYLIIDSSSSSWQIGHANKGSFIDTALASRSIVTDTINPYPINEASYFIIKFNYKVLNNDAPVLMDFSFKHRYNTDSLHDFGRIEISYDEGSNWYQMATYEPTWLSGTSTTSGQWGGMSNIGDTIAIRGNSNGWRSAIYFWDLCFAMKPDTGVINVYLTNNLLIRFSFFSDSIPDNKEGWEIDDIKLYKHFETCSGINEIDKDKPKIAPIPADNMLQIEFANTQMCGNLNLYNAIGNMVYQCPIINGSALLNTTALPNGMYYLLSENKINRQKYYNKILIQH